MKLRYIFITFTLIVGALLGIALGVFDNLATKKIDVISLNNEVEEIENEIKEGLPIEKIETSHSCAILYLDNEFYLQELNRAIKDSKIIVDYLEDDRLVAKIILPSQNEQYQQACNQTKLLICLIIGGVLLLGYGLIIFIYSRFIKPFKKLEHFAASISAGNFDIPLSKEKTDYFGAFTEAFDSMREALKKAQYGEYQANKSKKELIAGLSHDIKTPISSIIAICELLNFKIKDEDILRNINIIDSKAKIINTLMNNMFSAALDDLEMLNINPSEEESRIIPQIFEELNYSSLINFTNNVPEYLIKCDKLRLIQVIDNIVNNSYKYANTKIDVTFVNADNGLNVIIRDYGKGVNEADLPLVFGKFYRGENASKTSGSGLGLYLAKYFMNGMEGDIVCENDNGFVVTLFLKKI